MRNVQYKTRKKQEEIDKKHKDSSILEMITYKEKEEKENLGN